MRDIICFVSDFGLDDTWVGVCHAVIYRECPQARVVDLAHQVPPFDIRKGAAVAAAGVYQLPEATHLVIVDPGVGAGRADICLVTRHGTCLVGPDNGVLIPAAERAGGVSEAFVIDSRSNGSGVPLQTFRARDVMAPAAAALACGAEASSLGPALDIEALISGPFQAARAEGDHVVAEVVDIDRFGSVRIGIGGDEIERLGLDAQVLELSFGHTLIEVPFAHTFSDVEVGDPVTMLDSSGWLTLSVRMKSAAERYGIEPGVVARVRSLA